MAGGSNIAPNTLPTGGQVAAGSATIASTSTPQSAVMNVNQTSQRAVINWNSFNVGSNATVNFNQPNAQAVILNRVTSGSASVINGAINANGQVILINSSGVTFGRGAEVNAPGVVASTLNLADKEFMAGNNTYFGDGTGKIVNKGTITSTAEGGYIALLAPEVRNQGFLIAQKDSTVAIGAGKQITLNFQGQALISLRVDQGIYNAMIQNKHAIEAPSGLVIMAAGDANQLMASVINNTGTISASSIVKNGGVIEIVAATLNQAGNISSNGAGANSTGGQINLVGNNITLASNSTTSATGVRGGGQVNIGLGNTAVTGGSQVNVASPSALSIAQAQAVSANNAALASQNNTMAQTVTIQSGAVVNTSATQAGNGGIISIWSQVKTSVAGILQAMGGALSGNGGFIETSSKGAVDFASTVQMNTSAPNGKAGTWLLDPTDIFINTLGAGTIGAALANNNVVVDVNSSTVCGQGYGACSGSTGNLTVGADIIKLGQNLTTLTLTSTGIFNLNANISGQNLNVIINSSIAYLNSGFSISATQVTVQAVTSITASGSILTTSQSGSSLLSLISLMAQAIYINGTLSATSVNSSGGSITLNANQITINNGGVVSADGTATGGAVGAIYITSTGSFVDQGVIETNGVNTGGAINITSASDSSFTNASLKANGSNGMGGSISVTSSNGSITIQNTGLLAIGANGIGGNVTLDAYGNITSNTGTFITDGVSLGGSVNLHARTGLLWLTNSVLQAQSANNSAGSGGGHINIIADSGNIQFHTSDLLAHGYLGSGSISINTLTSAGVLTNADYFGIDASSIIDATQYVAGRASQVTGTLATQASAYLPPITTLVSQGLQQNLPNPMTLSVVSLNPMGPQGPQGSQSDPTSNPANSLISLLFGPPPGANGPGTTLGPLGPNLGFAPPPAAPAPSPPGGEPTSMAGGPPGASGSQGSAPPPPGSTVVAANGQAVNGQPVNGQTPNGRPLAPNGQSNSQNGPNPNGSNPPPQGQPNANSQNGGKDQQGAPKPAYAGKYANGLPSSNQAPTNKPAPAQVNAYQGKYAARVQTATKNPGFPVNAANDPLGGIMGNAGPALAVVGLPTSASDGLSASYDSVPSTTNSGINHVGQSHLSNAYKESLESTNLTATMNILIGL
ncbi:filamentous hemagglutinin N-terminal domain-containing protein [Polynucleobacter sp. MWH-P3-07-1]|uniref:beta strand repeat-containing protein n=1 Tax=Polynucleobacter sp. MWH-P3-07-1 TaxID=1743173 RepID=UPI001BFEB606|nr:filamentous hemagglutinin N-terminal domain-containing protein [Polynucleobacter sp. MWH-P3-07-1]QWD83998.1 filamentous hemagglutinin N-terminal domain-containing protein [Polynucleobacter sp. MWH-P3-07-1]